VSEVQAFCRIPTPYPPQLKVVSAPVAPVARTLYTFWNNDTSARWELVLALLGFALLFADARLRARGRPDGTRRLRERLLVALGMLSLLTYFNFGCFHFGTFLHWHEWT